MSHLRCFSLQKESNFLHGWASESLAEIMIFLLSTTVYKKRTKQRYRLVRFVWWEVQLIYFFFISSFLFFVFNTFESKYLEFSRLCRPSKNFTRRKIFFDFFGILSTLLQRLLFILFLVELTINFFIIK